MTMSSELQRFSVWTLPTPLRLAWLEWRAVGWLSSGVLLVGALLISTISLDRTTPPAVMGFQMVLVMAAVLSLALVLMPSPQTDQAWEITSLSGECEGKRQWRSMAATLLLALAFLTLLSYMFCSTYAPWTIWAWFAPRAAWFAAPVLLVLWRTGQPALAGGAVVGVYLIKYCPFPFALNPAVFFELRSPLHLLTAGLIFLAFAFPARWVNVSWISRLGTGFIAALLVMLPVLSLQAQPSVAIVKPTQLQPGLVAVDAPWAKLTYDQLLTLMQAAQNSRQDFRVLTVHPEQGEQDGTALAQSLGIKRFPILVDIRDGKAKILNWDWY